MKFETRAIEAGQPPEPRTGAVMTPVFQTSTYVQQGPGEHLGWEYARTHNPTREALETCLASLEGAKHCRTFASGMAATTTLLHTLQAGDHVLVCDDVYGGTYRLFDKVLSRLGITFTFADLTQPDAIAANLRPETKLLWLETPTNPLLKVIDIAAAANAAADRGVRVVVDNTFLSPYFQNPLQHGADVVVHSTTKFINGHSDVVGGAIMTSDDALGEQLAFLQNSIGAVPAPWDCFLIMRSVKTLAVRMRQHQENALAIANWLEGHDQVEQVIYPGLPSHPQHELALLQTRGHGGVITFRLKGGLDESRRFLQALKLFRLAESLGGVESLIEHPAIMTHASIEKPLREKLGITDNLIRISVGIEHIDDQTADLERAFAAAKRR